MGRMAKVEKKMEKELLEVEMTWEVTKMEKTILVKEMMKEGMRTHLVDYEQQEQHI